MMRHFGTRIRTKPDGMKLTRDNYVDMGKISKDGFSIPENVCESIAKRALENFDLNMQYFEALDEVDFNKSLDDFLSKKPQFKEVSNLEEYDGLPGYYLLVLGEYCQVYIGSSGNIRKRVKEHWTRTVFLDRLLFGHVGNSILSIDSFRALDTTRIFAFVTKNIFSEENELIDDLPDEYRLNRTIGGQLDGLHEAIENMKTRQLK